MYFPRTALAVASCSLAVLGLSACSDGGGGGEDKGAASSTAAGSPSPSNAVANVGQTTQSIFMDVKKYGYSYYLGDPKFAYQALSARCRAATAEADFVAKAQADRAEYGAQQIRMVEVPSLPDADHALVSYFVQEAALDVTNQPWVREEGNTWRNDGC